MRPPWLLLQLADAAFPAGGFAHSSGLEAALAFGADAPLPAFLAQTLRQAGRLALPFVRAACEEPARLAELDVRLDAMLLSHVGNRASRAQGRAFASAAARIFDVALETGPTHLAPVFGAVCGTLGLACEETAAAFLHGAARGVLSSAVRLGACGPLEAQRLHHEAAPLLDDILASSTHLDDAAQTAPVLELYASLHDRLDGRLFQS
jgi:urease accessory protein